MLLLAVALVVASALMSALISWGLLRALRLQKPRFRFLCLAIGAAVAAGVLAGMIVDALGERRLTSAGFLTHTIVIYATSLLALSLGVRTRVAFWSRGGAACILPWAAFFAVLLYWSTAPVYSHVHEFEKRIRCANCLKQVGLGLQMYAADHEGKRPEALEAFIETYLKVPELLECPATSSNRHEYDPKAARDARGIVMWDSLGNHKDGRNVLFGNGEVRYLTEEEFQVRKRQK